MQVQDNTTASVNTPVKGSITAGVKGTALQTAQEQVVDRVLKDITSTNLPSQLASSSSNPNQGLHGTLQEFMPGPSNRQQHDIAPADDRQQGDIAPADDRLQESVAR